MNIKEHLEKCAYAEIECPRCGIKYLNWQKDSHDCMEALKERIQQESMDLNHEIEQHGHDLERLAPKCPRNHPMKFQRGKPLGYGGTQVCDRCRISTMEEHEMSYHCKICKYDLCRACVLI